MTGRKVRRRGGCICRICGEKLSEFVTVVYFDDSTNLCGPCHALLCRIGVLEEDLRALAVRAEEHPLTADDLKRIDEEAIR